MFLKAPSDGAFDFAIGGGFMELKDGKVARSIVQNSTGWTLDEVVQHFQSLR